MISRYECQWCKKRNIRLCIKHVPVYTSTICICYIVKSAAIIVRQNVGDDFSKIVFIHETRYIFRTLSRAPRTPFVLIYVERFYALERPQLTLNGRFADSFPLTQKAPDAYAFISAAAFAKWDSAVAFRGVEGGCNARLQNRTPKPVIMHWLLNGCSAGEPTPRIRDA
jgi:hypothetical protein